MGEKRVPAFALLSAMTIWMGAIAILAFTVGPVFAIRALGATMVGSAVARLILPTGMVPDVRGRIWDAITLTLLGLALLGLSDWGNATNVAIGGT